MVLAASPAAPRARGSAGAPSEAIALIPSSAPHLHVCIVARKRLGRNTRVVRQSKALCDAGHSVTVAALEMPPAELRALTPKVRYLEIDTDPLVNHVLRALARVLGRGRSATPAERGERIGPRPGTAAPRRGTRRFGPALRRLLAPYANASRTYDFARRVVERLGAARCDVCQAHDSFALVAAERLAARAGAKLVYDALEAPDERSGVALAGTPRWLQRFEERRDKKIIRSASRVLSVGPALARWTAEKYGVEEPVVIRNCSLYREPIRNGDLRRDLGLGAGHKVVLLLGAVYRDQGIEQIAEAFAALPPEVHVAALGPISQPGYEQDLERLTEHFGLHGRLHFPPVQPQHRVLDYASGADLGLIARQGTTLNNRVSLPNKVFEMIMARLPIICGQLPNIVQIVETHEVGISFDETEPAAMARAIVEALAEPRYSQLKVRVEEAAAELCWERESERYVAQIEAQASPAGAGTP